MTNNDVFSRANDTQTEREREKDTLEKKTERKRKNRNRIEYANIVRYDWLMLASLLSVHWIYGVKLVLLVLDLCSSKMS